MNIPAGYDHQWLSLLDMTTNGYPSRIWPPMDIPVGYDHHLGYQKWIGDSKIKWRLIIDLEIRNTKVQISDFLEISSICCEIYQNNVKFNSLKSLNSKLNLDFQYSPPHPPSPPLSIYLQNFKHFTAGVLDSNLWNC